MEKQYTILVVDDEEILRNLIVRFLKKERFKIIEANSGCTALELLEIVRPDLVLSDIRMPGMDGITLLNKIKSDDRFKDIPVIIMTGYGDDDYIIQALRGGASNFYKKPFNFLEVSDSIKDILKRKREQICDKKFLLKSDNKIIEYDKELVKYGELTSSIIHDIKNNHHIISQICQEMLWDLEGSDTKKELYELVKKMLRRCKLLSYDISKFRNITARTILKMEAIDIKLLIEEIIDLLIPNSFNLLKTIPNKLPNVFGDKERLSQMFINLIQNAVQSMPNGGQINIQIIQNQGYIRVIITDTGCGIKDTDKEKIFNINYTTKQTGFGIGLYLVKLIIEQHKGIITFRTEENKGTTFNIDLPIFKE